MEKPKKHNKTYKGISGNELHLLNQMKTNKQTVYGVEELHKLTSWNKNRIHNTLHTLKQKKILTRIKRNKYTQTRELNQKIFEIATATIQPSYISHWTALSHYGFTTQQIKTIQLISTKQQTEIKLNNHTIETTTIKPQRYYGYRRMNNYVIADKEKALVDSLHQPEKCGGLNEYTHCLKNALKEINKKKLINYLIKYKNKSMNSRAGYLLEELEVNACDLQKHKSKSYVKLNPKKAATNKYNKRWGIIINQKIKEKEVIH